MPIETTILDLGDGDHAEIYLQMRHGTSRKIQEIYFPYMQKPEVMKILQSKGGSDTDRLAKITKVVNKSSGFLGANEIMVLGQVKAWSFGEVTQEVLDDIPEPKANEILAEINKHVPSPLAASGAGD